MSLKQEILHPEWVESEILKTGNSLYLEWTTSGSGFLLHNSLDEVFLKAVEKGKEQR